MQVICDYYKICTNKICIHRIPHIKEMTCQKGGCLFSICAKCEATIKEERKQKLEKINESHL